MSETLNKIMQEGIVKELPNCELCGNNEEKQKESQGKAFLILVYDKLVCGKCAVKMLQGKNCPRCFAVNQYTSKFCSECGIMLGD